MTKLPIRLALRYQAGRLLEQNPAIGLRELATKLIAFGREHCEDWRPEGLPLAILTAKDLACEACGRGEPHFCRNGVHHGAFGLDTPKPIG